MTKIKQTTLTAAMAVNAQVICDCRADSFRVGLAVNPDNGNNFIRVLECVGCGHQMPMVHTSDAQLAPSMANILIPASQN